MKRILTALVLLTGLFGAGGTVWAGDLDKRWKAYESGDYATALKEWRPLAEQGNAEGQFWLGHMYSFGLGVTQDKAEAFKWSHKAAEGGGGGDERAQFWLGKLYQNGDGVIRNGTKAVKWFRKAAEQGAVFSQVTLGEMHEKGNSVLQDLVTAHVWFNIAVANGNLDYADARDRVAGTFSIGTRGSTDAG
jgi:TPR repeat protein